ncbi:MAG: tRNA pseudouridine(38-40) synthase TruA [Armatimonadetes bacterium]|nr:tRNA pseudouridine(38-40) synthase TruA [Armatimonadota bacterium]
MAVRHFKLTVEYEGTKFAGFQWQKDQRTVQGELEKTIAKVMQEPIRILGAGRTDAGVHATGQVIKFQTCNGIPVDRIPYALNAEMPSDIRIRRAEKTSAEFHPRYDAKSRRYAYLIDNKRFPSVLLRRVATHVPQRLDADRMQLAADYLVGTHNFASFEAAGSDRTGSSVRDLTLFRVRRDGSRIRMGVVANAFLYKMVRNMVGTLIQVGMGRVPSEHVGEIIESCNRKMAGPTAPPQGLCLVKVSY